MAFSWVDTHAHLVDETLQAKHDHIFEECRSKQITRLLCVAVDAKSSRQCLDVAQSTRSRDLPQVFASAGIHPNYAHQATSEDWPSILGLLANEDLVALGETGLDKYWDDCPFETQLIYFRKHWEASRETKLPVIIHMRECEQEMMTFLREEYSRGPLCGVMHSFSGTMACAEECIAMGLYLSFSGVVTYKKNAYLREIVSKMQTDRILLETDCPYLSPEPVRSTRPNLPSLMVHTASVVAEARGIGLGELSQLALENSLRLFTRMR